MRTPFRSCRSCNTPDPTTSWRSGALLCVSCHLDKTTIPALARWTEPTPLTTSTTSTTTVASFGDYVRLSPAALRALEAQR